MWQTEGELDKTKVLVSSVTVANGDEPALSQDLSGYNDNAAPELQECVAIDLLRQSAPTAFSNVTFEMDRQNTFFVQVTGINYASSILRTAYLDGTLIYRCCYQLDDDQQMMYYTISK